MVSCQTKTHPVEYMGHSVWKNQIGTHNPGVIDKSIVSAHSHSDIGSRASPKRRSIHKQRQVAHKSRKDVVG